MAKIALIGASGNAGSRILKELSDRGHKVTAIARSPEKIASLPNVVAKQGDVFDQAGLSELLKGHDAVISAVHFTASDPVTLIEAVRASGVPRYLVVGGAGSLEIAPGQRVVDLPDFPAAYKAEATKGAEFLDRLRGEKQLDWTFLSPSAEFVPGKEPANSVSAKMSFSAMPKAAAFPSRTTPLRLSMKSRSRSIPASVSPSVIERYHP